MCKIMEDLQNEAKKETLLDNIRNLMRKMKWTAQQAMDALDVPADKQKEYAALIWGEKMCKTIEDLLNEAEKETLLNSIRSLMETMNFSAQQAMDALKVPADKQKEFADLIWDCKSWMT